VKEFARDEWARAARTLQTAELIMATDPESAASRAYYAAFHAVTALFAARDQTFTKHTGLRAAVHRELIKTGQWPVAVGEAYNFLMDLRETGDYGGSERVTAHDAQRAVEAARRVLAACQQSQPELETL